MDRNLHTDDFERLLREKSDELRMYPSKRTWYSVYNNIHPGRKWPSVVMSIVLITSLLLIGYLNTSEPNRLASITKPSPASPRFINEFASSTGYRYQPILAYTPLTSSTTGGQTHPAGTTENGLESRSSGNKLADLTATSRTGYFAAEETRRRDGNLVTTEALDTEDDHLLTTPTLEVSPSMLKIDPVELTSASTAVESDAAQNQERNSSFRGILSGKMTEADGTVMNLNPEGLVRATSDASASRTKTTSAVKEKPLALSQEEKAWIEHYAMYNKPHPKKWAGKLAWQMYATPSVVYRELTTDPTFGATSNSAPFVIPVNNQDINSQVVQKPSFGLEAGAGIQYPIFKRLRLKTGLQLNFTRYNSLAYHNTHPVATKLTMHDYTTNSTYELFRTTPYSNKTGLSGVKLHNETFQVSLPVGFDFKLAGNEALRWNVGVTIQPTYIIGGTSYLISSDRRNYVKESSMINKWNMNVGFETFLSYKANGLTYQVGPQFRTQLFSTNIKQFAVEERLQAYGIKFGIMKTLK